MKKFPILYVIFAGIAWGTAGLFVDYLTRYGFTSFQLAMARCAVSAVASLVVALVFERKQLKITWKQGGILVLAGLAFFFMAAFYYMAMANSSVSTAAVLLNMAPVLVMGVSLLFWGERFTLRKGLAVLCALVGCALVTGIVGGLRFAPKGILFGFLSCCCYASYSICLKIAGKWKLGSGVITTYSFLVASVVAVFFVSPRELAAQVVSVSWYTVAMLVLFGFTTGFLASFTYSKAMGRLPAGVVSALAAVEPLVLTLTSIAFLGERLTVFSGIGIVLILSSVVILSFEKQ